MEADVVIRCRKSDVELVKSILDETGKVYAAKLKKEIPKLKDKEIKCRLAVDDRDYLPELAKEAGLPSWYC